MSNPGPNTQSTQNLVPVSVALDSLGNPTGKMPLILSVSSITYNANGSVNTYVKGGITYTVSYNANGFVSGISGAGGNSYTPTYDSNFRVTGVTVA